MSRRVEWQVEKSEGDEAMDLPCVAEIFGSSPVQRVRLMVGPRASATCSVDGINMDCKLVSVHLLFGTPLTGMLL